MNVISKAFDEDCLCIIHNENLRLKIFAADFSSFVILHRIVNGMENDLMSSCSHEQLKELSTKLLTWEKTSLASL